MAEQDPLIDSLLSALEHSPDDVPLRLHLAQLLVDGGDLTRALEQCSKVLQIEPGNEVATALLAKLTVLLQAADSSPDHDIAPSSTFDWAHAERQMEGVPEQVAPASPFSDPQPTIRLDDVGGMEEVKRELYESFLVPMANPALRKAYGSSLRGGLLLYGAPGCGKTYLGRALAGELGASFFSLSLADILDSMFGQSEKNVQAIFQVARAHRPSVIFFDEVDAIGQKRANLRSSPMMRGTVNQLLSEMDGSQADNEGVFVLGASNQPWDVDPALRRPGRFDRIQFVPPPDEPARGVILRLHMTGRPVDSIDYRSLAKHTQDYSGADLARLCEVATRKALTESARTGEVRSIGMGDIHEALRQVGPTTREWFTTARNVVHFANQDGTYDDLAAYVKARKL